MIEDILLYTLAALLVFCLLSKYVPLVIQLWHIHRYRRKR